MTGKPSSRAIVRASRNVLRGAALRARDAQALERGVEFLAIFGDVERALVAADDRHPAPRELVGQIDGGLAAEGQHHALGAGRCDTPTRPRRRPAARRPARPRRRSRSRRSPGLLLTTTAERPGLAQRPGRVNAGVVELDPLADADRAAADDHDRRLRRLAHLVGFAAREIVVRRARRKLGGGRIDHAELPAVVDALELAAEERVDAARRVAGYDRALDQRRRRIHHRLARLGLERRSSSSSCDQLLELPEPEAVDRRERVRCRRRCGRGARARKSRRCGRASAPRPRASSSSSLHSRERAAGERLELEVEPAHRLHQRGGEGAADPHRLAGRLHLRSEAEIGQRKLVERPARDLHHAVVERRLVGRFGDPGDGVGDLVERVAERDLGRDLGDRIPGRF